MYCPRSASIATFNLPRLQALSDADARFASLVTMTTCSPDRSVARHQLAYVVQVVAVVGMKLDCVPAACDSRERGQGWHEQPPREGVVDRADQIRVDARFQHRSRARRR